MSSRGSSPELLHEMSSMKQELADERPETADHASVGSSGIDALAEPLASPTAGLKRRRVARACDECRRKKIKCDGRQPCTHCAVYTYECTYDQPSNRRRHQAPQLYIASLEERLQRAEAIIKKALPHVNLDDSQYDVPLHTPQPSLSHASGLPPPATRSGSVSTTSDLGEGLSNSEADPMLESMVEMTGQLDLDDRGNWDFQGHSSGLSFIRQMRKQYGDLLGPEHKIPPFFMPKTVPDVYRTTKSSATSSVDMELIHELPARAHAKELVSNALDDGTALMRFVHQPTFYSQLDRIYDLAPEQYGDEENRFLPLLYVVLALGCLFAKNEESSLEKHGYACAISQGFKYYTACRQMIDITDCRDLTSLQAVVFMILFLQCSARLSTCYCYIGIALRAALRMGLHRSVSTQFNPIEQETRKRVFWVIRKMDTYISVLLGLPRSVSDEDIDQEQPVEVDDEYITQDGIMPMPEGKFSLMVGVNAQTRLLKVLSKLVKYIYPVKGFEASSVGQNTRTYLVSYAKVREIEQDLQEWMDELPLELRVGEHCEPQLARVQQLLRLTYGYIQMMLYRPFLHYISARRAGGQDRRAYACAAACVSVSRNLVHITTAMKRRGLLMGAYWFAMYATFFSILTLVFYVLENPNDAGTLDILKDALEGKKNLASLSKRSLAADRCTATLANIFAQLPERLGRSQPKAATPLKKRRATSPHPGNTAKAQNIETAHSSVQHSSGIHHSGIQQTASATALAGRPPVVHASQSLPSSLESATCDGSPGFYAHSDASTDDIRSQLMPSPPIPAEQLPLSPQPVPPPPPSNFYGLLDLNAMMFPSTNPFEYPNNPMAILENEAYDTTAYAAADYPNNDHNDLAKMEGLDSGAYAAPQVELYGTLPPYLVPVPQQQAPGAAVYSADDIQLNGLASAFPNMVYFQPTELPPPAAEAPSGFQLDDIFGRRDWSINNNNNNNNMNLLAQAGAVGGYGAPAT